MKRTAYRSRDSYAQVNWDMVEEVGGDITLAVVFDWITWKADAAYDGVQDEDGNTWYATSIPALATTMKVSEKIVRRALDELVKRGHLASAQLHLGGAYDRTKAYRPVWEELTVVGSETPADELEETPEDPGKASAPEGRSIRPHGPISSAPEGRSHLPSGADVPLFETYTEVKDKELFDAREIEASKFTVEQYFDLFYDWYPRHEGRKPALAKFIIAARKIPPAQLVQFAIDYHGDPNRNEDAKFLPLPATWLHQERWTDERPPATAAPPRKLTNTEQALAEYNRIYGGSDGRETDPPALDSGFSS